MSGRWLDELAACLEYPSAGLAERARRAARGAPSQQLAAALIELAQLADSEPLAQLEERYTRLFDLAARCSLHAGYQLFGDAYERGELLVGLTMELRAHRIDRGSELPDHLSLLLRLLGGLEQSEAETLREALLGPALAAMRQALETVDHPWARLVCALAAWVPAPQPDTPRSLPIVGHGPEAMAHV